MNILQDALKIMTYIHWVLMGLKEDLVRMLMLETGCSNKQYQTGFTLIEILVVLIIIGITSTLITLNFGTLIQLKKANSFQKGISYLTEESIVGNIIGLYLSSDNQFAKYLSEETQNEIDPSYKILIGLIRLHLEKHLNM